MLDIEKLKGTETPTEVGLKINEIIETGGTSSRNIGELVTSLLPQTDAGLHLVDGALINGDGANADFVAYIANLYGDGSAVPSYFTTEEEWQTSVTNYGVCGKFVYDSVTNTVRLPKATGIIEGTIDLSVLGDLVEAGLPNITGTITTGTRKIDESYSDGASGALKISNYSTAKSNGYSGGSNAYEYQTVSFDASRSNPIYGKNDKVQPQTIKGFVYICVANSKKTDVEVNIDNVMTDVNGKADIDLSNTTDVAKDLISRMGMPSANNRYVNLTLGATNTKYVAPANGYFSVCMTSSAAGQYINIWSVSDDEMYQLGHGVMSHATGNQARLTMPCQKGKRIALSYNYGGSNATYDYFRFVYAEGAQ